MAAHLDLGAGNLPAAVPSTKSLSIEVLFQNEASASYQQKWIEFQVDFFIKTTEGVQQQDWRWIFLDTSHALMLMDLSPLRELTATFVNKESHKQAPSLLR